MTQKKFFRKYSFVFILSTLLLMNSISIPNNKNVLKEEQNVDVQKYYAPSNGYNVAPLDSEKSFYNAFETFAFKSTFPIDAISSSDDLSLDDYSIIGNDILCSISNILNKSSILLSFYINNEIIDRIELFFAYDSSINTYYSSSLSLDTVLRLSGQSVPYILDDYENKKGVDDKQIPGKAIGASGTISGTLRWKDDEGNSHPLVEARVKVLISGSTWQGLTTTGYSGYYSITYRNI